MGLAIKRISDIGSWSGYDRFMTEPPEPSKKDQAWDSWDDKPLEEMLTVDQAWEILETLRFGPDTAKKELDYAINKAFDDYCKQCDEDEGDAAFERYISSEDYY